MPPIPSRSSSAGPRTSTATLSWASAISRARAAMKAGSAIVGGKVLEVAGAVGGLGGDLRGRGEAVGIVGADQRQRRDRRPASSVVVAIALEAVEAVAGEDRPGGQGGGDARLALVVGHDPGELAGSVAPRLARRRGRRRRGPAPDRSRRGRRARRRARARACPAAAASAPRSRSGRRRRRRRRRARRAAPRRRGGRCRAGRRRRRRGSQSRELEAHRRRHDSCRAAPGLYDSPAPSPRPTQENAPNAEDRDSFHRPHPVREDGRQRSLRSPPPSSPATRSAAPSSGPTSRPSRSRRSSTARCCRPARARSPRGRPRSRAASPRRSPPRRSTRSAPPACARSACSTRRSAPATSRSASAAAWSRCRTLPTCCPAPASASGWATSRRSTR